ncbi:MAG: uroporphyrinogen-III synthase [Nitrospinota bacterium]|nr:uroporphyrinogen-III synthase [Nitrospinota bacterium]
MAIAEKENIQPPALTIVGEVVKLKESIDWFENLPLFGKTIVVTRSEDQSKTFTNLLLERGAEPFSFPVIQTVAPADWGPMDEALGRLHEYDGLIFTSVNGVKFFTQRLSHLKKDIRELKGVRLYAIGPKTAQAVQELGIRVDVVPEEFVAESLLESLGKENVEGKYFLLPRAKEARKTLPDTLASWGAVIDVIPAYETLKPDSKDDALPEKLKRGEIDCITFTASSTVKNFMAMLGKNYLASLTTTAVACIGPITAKTAEELGLRVDIVPQEFTVEGLVAALEKHFSP